MILRDIIALVPLCTAPIRSTQCPILVTRSVIASFPTQVLRPSAMDLGRGIRLHRVSLRLPDLELSWLVRRFRIRVPDSIMSTARPTSVSAATSGCNTAHSGTLPDGHFVFRGLVTLENGVNQDMINIDAEVCLDRHTHTLTVSLSKPIHSAFLAPGYPLVVHFPQSEPLAN